MELYNFLEQIPDGKKRELLGASYVDGLKNYIDQNLNKDVDLTELLIDDISNIIHKKEFISFLKLFCEDDLNIIMGLPTKNTDLSNKEIIKRLAKYFQIVIEQSKEKIVISENKFELEIPLHDFQERIRRKVINAIFQGEKRFLIHMPTGSGKTRTAAEIVLDFIRLSASKSLLNEKVSVLWIAQSSELCAQASETVKWILSKKGVSEINIEHFFEDWEIKDNATEKSSIVFAGIQKLLSGYKKETWRKLKNEIYLVIVDEAHRSIASEWVKALNYFVSDSSVYLIGLTATPGSSEDEKNYLLSTFYNSNKFSLMNEKYQELKEPIKYLVERDFLSQIERINIDSNITINNAILESKNGELKFHEKVFKNLSSNTLRNNSIVNIIKEENSLNKKLLVFTCGIEHNKILKAILKYEGIKAESIDINSKNRTNTINEFKNGDLNILLNFGVLTTGFDAPKTNVCIIARPVGSIVLYSQMVGRILRGPKNNGNKYNKLYTIKDNLDHGDYDNLFNSFNDFYK